MTKFNPLFVDSTKFHGDMIPTQIELKNVLIYDDETLFVMVTNHKDFSRRLQMKRSDERGYEATLHLNHQTPITFRFVIEKNGERVFQSANYQSRAQYAVIQDWEPLMGDLPPEEPILVAPVEPPKAGLPGLAPRVGQSQSPSRVKESTLAVRNLIEKWGF